MNNKRFKEFFLIAFGSVLVTLSFLLFFKPANLAPGGVNGLSVVLGDIFPTLTVGTYYALLNLILFIIGFITIGKAFGAKTIFSAAFISILTLILEKPLLNVHLSNDIFVNAFFGTLLGAIGMAIVFNQDASTGGTDIIAKILNKYFHIDIGMCLLVVDAIVTILAFYQFGSTIGFYSIIAVLLNGTLIDRIILGTKSAKEILIMSHKNKQIRDFIIEELDRSCTMLKGYGGYTKADIEAIYVVLNRSDFIKLRNYIKLIDTKAFISVNEVHEVLGEGYDDISLI